MTELLLALPSPCAPLSSLPGSYQPTRPSVQCHLGWQATLLATLITLALPCVTDLTQHQGPVTLSSLILLPAFPQGLREGFWGSPDRQDGADRKWCSPRKSSKENLSLSQIWNTARAGILLSVLSSLQKASWPRGEAEEEAGEQD